ncbi:hypothetical protein [Kitasatospora cineracea]|uniref:Tetratricopeptide repeat protein n=1 Tax=Kitasatospora cineracea TaxID=88074 RepID=A0A8G1XDF9_9ACTN|nr:hypothetical protein [Kitasatospora cineracea]ROR45814.1 hypothetical protein EDD39_4063 [Kitasatospora cineracea]
MFETDRVVLLRYDVDGEPQVGTGLRVGGETVLTADHCAGGSNLRAVRDGREFPAQVVVRTHRSDVDLAVLRAPGIGAKEPMGFARVDRSVAGSVRDCQAVGFPRWKRDARNGRTTAQPCGWVPTAEGIAVGGPGGAPVGLLSFKMSGPEIPLHPTSVGTLGAGSPWGGMSGAAVVGSGLVIGVVRSHNLSEGTGSLTLTPVDAIDHLAPDTRDRMWAALGVPDPAALPVLPGPAGGPPAPAAPAAVAPAAAPAAARSRAGVVRDLTVKWVQSGPPVAVLQGFSGVGKTRAALKIKDAHPRRSFIDVELSAGVHTLEQLLILVGGAFAEAGKVGVLLGTDPVRDIADSLRDGTVLLLDDFHRCFVDGSGAPAPEVQHLVNAVARRIHGTGGRILLVADQAAAFPWITDGDIHTLPGMSEGEGVNFLAETLRRTGVPNDLPPDRTAEIVGWLGGNPRALQILAGCLQSDSLEDLIGLSPKAWELQDRNVSEPFAQSLERAFLDRFIGRLDDTSATLLRRASVHRTSFTNDALKVSLWDAPGQFDAAKRKLTSSFLVEKRNEKHFSMNPIAKEISLRALSAHRGELARAHAAVGKFHARHFKAKRMGTQGSDFLEARYHLFVSGETEELAVVAKAYALHLDRVYGYKTKIEEDPRERDELISLLSAALDEASPSWRLHLHLALLLEARARPDDLPAALEQVVCATASPNASKRAWAMRIRLTDQLRGTDAAVDVAVEADDRLTADTSNPIEIHLLHAELLARDPSRLDEAVQLLKAAIARSAKPSPLAPLYQAAAELLGRDEARVGEAVELLREGIGKVPVQGNLFSLYQAAAELLARDESRVGEAVELLREGIGRIPAQGNLFSLYQAAAMLLGRNGDRVEEAVELLREGIEKVPAQFGLFSLYQAAAGLLARDEARVGEAVELLREGIARVPVQFGLFSLYQAAAGLLGRDEARVGEAVELLREGIGRIPAQYSLFSLYQAAAELLARDEARVGEAVELLREGIGKVPVQGNLSSLYQAAAELLARDEARVAEAVELLREGIGRIPAQYSLYSLYQSAAELLARDESRVGEAVELLREGIGRIPVQFSLFSLYQVAAELLGRDEGRVDEAVELLREGITRVPVQGNLFSLYQVAAELLGRDEARVDEAVELLREGIEKVPAQYSLFSLYQAAAELLGRDRERVEEAVELLREGIGKIPAQFSLFSLYQTWAIILAACGEEPAAVEVLLDGVSHIGYRQGAYRLAEGAAFVSAGIDDDSSVDRLRQTLAEGGYDRQVLLIDLISAEKQGDWEEALRIARSGQELYGTTAPFLSQEVISLVALGRTADAVSRVRAMGHTRSEDSVRWLRGFVHACGGDVEACRADMQPWTAGSDLDLAADPVAFCVGVWDDSRGTFGSSLRFHFPFLPHVT